MREQPTQFFVGLDIGTSKVRCVVGALDSDDETKLSIVGHGTADNIGMRKGMVVHIEDVSTAIEEAIREAERISGAHITGATINVNGSHVLGLDSKGVIAISTANRHISMEDRLRVEEAATIVKLPPNREIIQVFAQNYRVDGQDNIKDPVGMQGVRLEVDTHIVTASSPNMRNLDSALDRARLQIHHHTVSSLAAAEAVLTRQQKESGTLLLDIGAGTTNIVVLEDGEVQYVSVLPIGGINLTNDLAIGLKTDLDVAEAVKLEHATLLSNTRRTKAVVTVNQKRYEFDPEDIQMIIEARVEELLELVDKELRKIQRSQKLPGGVVLVGGTAKLPGLDEFTKEKLGLAARVGTLQPIGGLQDTVDDPAYHSVVGLALLDMLLLPADHMVQGAPSKSVFNLLDGILGKVRKAR